MHPLSALWPRRAVALLLAAVLAAGCYSAAPAAPAPQPGYGALYAPARDLGQLFHDVQLTGLFPDSKTFVDAQPLAPPEQIAAYYASVRDSAGLDLRAFVQRFFAVPQETRAAFRTDPALTMEEHIHALWPVLTRSGDSAQTYSSLIPLSHPYVVPGGRFREVYYWDSYFTMLGLVRSGRTDLVRSMLDNFAHLARTAGHIPNGNRTYYLSRSQPPYFAAMVGLYATATDTSQALRYLDALVTEHAFWMDGAERVGRGQAHRRVVRLPDGSLLNRYWDDLATPRPESYREDYTLAQTLPEPVQREAFYRNVRAAAESGWDFSSRWMRDPADLRTLETTALAPIDLNSLLYNAEATIAALYAFRDAEGDRERAARYAALAAQRRTALLAAAWDSASGFFYDVRWRTGERVTDRPTLAAATSLYFGLAAPAQGTAVAARLVREFLHPGGFVTTSIESGQQWDAPNGWPPLQWLAIQGIRRYGYGNAADEARERWLALNRRTFEATGRMMEKYDVMNPDRPAGGGEYPTQDGFGWTNGVALRLSGFAVEDARLIALPALVPADPDEVGMDERLPATMDSIIAAALRAGAAPGASLAVGRYGRLVHIEGYGRIDTAPGTAAVTDSTLFDLASLTKVVATTTAAMLLEEDGRLDLDRPVRHYLPELDAPDKSGITVHQLLTHSGGFVSGGPLWRDSRTAAEFIEYMNERPLIYVPGDSSVYSDWDLILTGLIVERITGQRLDAFLQQRVWGPLGMRDTRFNPLSPTSLPEGVECTAGFQPGHPLLPRIAASEVDTIFRDRLIHGIVHDENACALAGVAGHAGLFSSARDLAVFAQMMLNGGEYNGVRILQPATIARWTARQNEHSSRALGWDTPAPRSSAGAYFSPRSFGHTGFTGTSIWMDPERGLFVILLTNRVNPTRANTLHVPLRRDVADAAQRAIRDAPVYRWR